MRALCGDEVESDILAKDWRGSRGEAEVEPAKKPLSGMCKVIPVGRFKGGSSLKDVDVGENASAAERFEPGLGEGDGGRLTWRCGRVVTFVEKG